MGGARQAAIGIGLVQSEYFPVLALAALGGYKSVASPRRRMSLRTDFSAWICSRLSPC
jgi:hypothetical protein